jgi:hypothetical protein
MTALAEIKLVMSKNTTCSRTIVHTVYQLFTKYSVYEHTPGYLFLISILLQVHKMLKKTMELLKPVQIKL